MTLAAVQGCWGSERPFWVQNMFTVLILMRRPLKVARAMADDLGLENMTFIAADIRSMGQDIPGIEPADTVIQNPPFGSQGEG